MECFFLLLVEPEQIKDVVVPLHWLAVVLAYFGAAAIAAFDSDLSRGVRLGEIPTTVPPPPNWVGLIYWLQWILLAALAIFDWKFAVLVFLGRFVLSFLGVLQIIGAVLMAPFMQRHK